MGGLEQVTCYKKLPYRCWKKLLFRADSSGLSEKRRLVLRFKHQDLKIAVCRVYAEHV